MTNTWLVDTVTQLRVQGILSQVEPPRPSLFHYNIYIYSPHYQISNCFPTTPRLPFCQTWHYTPYSHWWSPCQCTTTKTVSWKAKGSTPRARAYVRTRSYLSIFEPVSITTAHGLKDFRELAALWGPLSLELCYQTGLIPNSLHSGLLSYSSESYDTFKTRSSLYTPSNTHGTWVLTLLPLYLVYLNSSECPLNFRMQLKLTACYRPSPQGATIFWWQATLLKNTSNIHEWFQNASSSMVW